MRRNILSKLVYGCFLLAMFASCKVKKPLVNVEPTKPTAPPAVIAPNLQLALLDSIRAHQLLFQTLSVKAKALIVIGQKENNADLTIRIKKDEAIWVSVTALAGIEAARAMITPDSVKILDKLNSIYIKKPFSFMYGYAGGEISFSMLQAMLTGNSNNEFLAGKASGSETGPVLDGVFKNYAFNIFFNNMYKATRVHLANGAAKKDLSINYIGFSLPNGQELPQTVAIRSVAENNIAIDLEYSKPVFNQPIEMPFTVPKRFGVIN